jgi:hypothetical protein
MIPLCIHSGVALTISLLAFPRTISSQFSTQLAAVLSPLQSALLLHVKLLADPGADASAAGAAAAKAEAALLPLRASARLLARDAIYSRGSPEDLSELHDPARRLAVRAHGLAQYFSLRPIQATLFMRSTAPSAQGSRAQSRAPRSRAVSRRPSMTESMGSEAVAIRIHPSQTISSVGNESEHHRVLFHKLHRRHGHHSQHEHEHGDHGHHRHALHDALFHSALNRPQSEVGVYESERLAAAEDRLRGRTLMRGRWIDEEQERIFEREAQALLAQSTKQLLEKCAFASGEACKWIAGLRKGRLSELVGLRTQEREERRRKRGEAIIMARKDLEATLDSFRSIER